MYHLNQHPASGDYTSGLPLVLDGNGRLYFNRFLGFELSLACSKGYFPDPEVVRKAMDKGCGKIQITSDPKEAVRNAAVIYTDVWASMGQESEQQARLKIFEPFQVNEALIQNASGDVIVMHCLPAHRGEEITEAVLAGPHSVVWNQSENKLHMHKAILETLIRPCGQLIAESR